MKGLYYPYSENKGADQLRSYCAADLRLCFRICKKTVFSLRDSYVTVCRSLCCLKCIVIMVAHYFYSHLSYETKSCAIEQLSLFDILFGLSDAVCRL